MGLPIIEVDYLPDYKGFNYARLGSFSLSTYRNRYVAQENIIEYGGIRDTVSTHYRNVIKGVQFNRKGAPSYPLSYPHFAVPITLPSAVYLDLRSAFQQIACAYGFQVWFKEGKAIAYGESIPNQPLFGQFKLSRGLLVSAHGEKARFTEWKDGTLKCIAFPNSSYAPYLRYAIWRTLHALMNKVKPYIFYCHTDGIIINTAFLARVEKIWKGYHVNFSIKAAGVSTIYGVGSYQVGEYSTVNKSGSRAKDFILSDEYDDWWLEKYVSGLARRTNLPDHISS